MFEIARFVSECETAIATGKGQEAVREIVAATVSDPAAVLAVFGEPKRVGVRELYRSPKLTILNIVWLPSFTATPHNHMIWAEVGVYSGREDHIFWRRCASGAKWSIEATGGTSLCAGACLSLDVDAIHSVTNPLDTPSASLHVYGGDLVPSAPRSMWDGDTLLETALSYQRDDRLEEIYNARLAD